MPERKRSRWLVAALTGFVFGLLGIPFVTGLLGFVNSIVLAVTLVPASARASTILAFLVLLTLVAAVRYRVLMPFVIFLLFTAIGVSIALTPPAHQVTIGIGDWATLVAQKKGLDAAVEARTRSGDSHPLVIITVDSLMLMAYGVAYDASDEIALGPGNQSAPWRAKMTGHGLDTDCWEARHLYAHYYSWFSPSCGA